MYVITPDHQQKFISHHQEIRSSRNSFFRVHVNFQKSIVDGGLATFYPPIFFPRLFTPLISYVKRGGKNSLFDIKLRLFTPDFSPTGIPNYIKIILGDKVGSYG